MKKKFIAMLLVSALTSALITGCGSTGTAPEATEQAQTAEQADTTEETQETEQELPEEQEEAGEEEAVGMANPWVDITEDEAKELCTRLFKAPDGAKDIQWSKCEDLGDPDKGVGPLIQLSFSLDDLNYTARAQMGASQDADIAGNYVEWTVGPEETTLANWGEGNMIGETYRAINDSGYVDMITWYDIEIGISYSLSVAAADLDGFDIQAVAEQMYSADNEPYVP